MVFDLSQIDPKIFFSEISNKKYFNDIFKTKNNIKNFKRFSELRRDEIDSWAQLIHGYSGW